jgi:hypothetical protein
MPSTNSDGFRDARATRRIPGKRSSCFTCSHPELRQGPAERPILYLLDVGDIIALVGMGAEIATAYESRLRSSGSTTCSPGTPPTMTTTARLRRRPAKVWADGC